MQTGSKSLRSQCSQGSLNSIDGYIRLFLAWVNIRLRYRILDRRFYRGLYFLFGFEFPNNPDSPLGHLINHGSDIDEVL